MDLDQTSLVVDTYQFDAQADLHLLPRRTQDRRHRVKSVLIGYVVVWMHLGRAPVSDLVGLAVPWGQDTAFLIQEDLQGLTPGGAWSAARRRRDTSVLPHPCDGPGP